VIEMRTSTFRSMGTDVTVLGPEHPAFDRAVDIVAARFVAEDLRFSRFRGDSELTRINRAGGGWTNASDGFVEVVDAAVTAARATDGIFDPTVHDALIAAGYDRDFDELLAGARAALHPATPCGRWREIRTRPGAVDLPAGVHLDLGGIAKGWCADRAAADAIASGLPWVLVNAGGDLRVIGRAPLLDVAIEDPETTGELLHTTIAAGAIATSSVCKRAWGTDLHHVIDPFTGQPARTELLQASVWAPTCTEAEVAATHALIIGVDAAHRYPAVLVTRGAEIVISMPVAPEVAA
jgi:thiamine biosynthesis lipoprotein